MDIVLKRNWPRHNAQGRGASVRDYSEDELESVELPSSLFEIEDRDSGGRRQNYASLDAGATILDSAPETKSPTNLLVPDKDRYMLIPCEKSRKWVVVSLSEDVHADAIALANFEKFSSPVKDFLVLGSVAYPTDTWFVLGNFTAAHASGEQVFQLESQSHVRYIKLRFFSHYGSEYYCTLSQLKCVCCRTVGVLEIGGGGGAYARVWCLFRVFGRTFTQVISQLEKSIDAEAALDVAALPVPPPATGSPSEGAELSGGKPETGSAAIHSVRRPVDGSSDGESERNPPAAAAAAVDSSGAGAGVCLVELATVNPYTPSHGDASEQTTHRQEHRVCRLDDDVEPVKLNAGSATVAAEEARSLPEPPAKAVAPSSTDAPLATSSDGDTNATVASASSTGVPDAASANAIKANATPAATTVPVPASASTTAPPQGLGRLESIFVRITKKSGLKAACSLCMCVVGAGDEVGC